MAFRPVRLADAFNYVSIQDPAIDWDALANAKLAEVDEKTQAPGLSHDERLSTARGKVLGEWATKIQKNPQATLDLPIKNGSTATKFLLGVIPPDEANRIQDECLTKGRYEELCFRAFCAALRHIDGWHENPPKRRVGEVEYVDPSWIRAQFVGRLRKVAVDAGRAAWAWNHLSEDDAKN